MTERDFTYNKACFSLNNFNIQTLVIIYKFTKLFIAKKNKNINLTNIEELCLIFVNFLSELQKKKFKAKARCYVKVLAVKAYSCK